MTLTQRNMYFKAGIILSLLSFLLILAFFGKLLPLLAEYSETAVYRGGGFLQNLTGRYFETVPIVPFFSIAAASLYTLIVSVTVYIFFEKTHTQEILFFALFALSFVFETFRIMLPLEVILEYPHVFLILGTRALVFGRLFGVLSLFASSVYAAGLDIQKQGKVIIAIIIGILVLSIRLPVNGSSWDTCYTLLYAYASMFRFAEIALASLTVISFLAAAHIRGNEEYNFIALGALLISIGRRLLISADTWVTPIPGVILLCIGTVLIIIRLHRIYLWL